MSNYNSRGDDFDVEIRILGVLAVSSTRFDCE